MTNLLLPVDPQAVVTELQAIGYVADEALATSAFLLLHLGRPLLLEGPSGVGKTELAQALATLCQTELIRLQCYEGLDVHSAVYEWNYQKQLLAIRLEEASGANHLDSKQAQIFSEEFLLERPLLSALRHSAKSPVLLIDEVDRADEEFEAFLLEILSEWQITIPEIGSIRAEEPPYVILTGNRTRELSDAVRRRCFYLWIDYPPYEKELSIVRNKVPDVDAELAGQMCRFMELVRQQKLEKIPGVAETLDWARALAALHQDHLEPSMVEETLGLIFKDRNDVRLVRESLTDFLGRLGIQAKEMKTAEESPTAAN